MGLRRIWAKRIRKRTQDIWPILESAGRKPDGWPGWPNGKQFALVLTHDVEGPNGLAKVRPLAELEMELGFRSCFNLVPEGSYDVPEELREWLVSHGFEVGVHDLYHDGKLFASREIFRRHAPRINHYLREWNAVGFRAGFMHHNLDWQQEIEVLYDTTTFDTDPFEPQPDGVGTIFPFWVPAQFTEFTRRNFESKPSDSDKGYVELPYTVPQDSTLFLLLNEPNNRIWLSKLKWLATHGGMFLVNVHPDYLRFDGERFSSRTFPIAHYQNFLEHVRNEYRGLYWQPLPREIARYVIDLKPRPLLRNSRRICMLTHSFYETDNRVMRYAETLVQRGDEVDVVALRRSKELPYKETIQGVRVFRVKDRIGKTERTRLDYLRPILCFFIKSSVWLWNSNRIRHYDLIHVHNIPDFLAFAAWYPKITGSKIILDIHDILPEFYASKFGSKKGMAMSRLLRWIERISALFADHIIISNHLWRDLLIRRSVTSDKCSVFVNNVDLKIFSPHKRTRTDNRFILLFPGTLHWHQGLDIAIRAFSQIANQIPEAEFHIYGSGPAIDALQQFVEELQLNGRIQFRDMVPIRRMPQIMANTDLGIVPKRANSFGDQAYSTKIMEFMSQGVPVIISRTQIDNYYFNPSIVTFFEPGNDTSLAQAILELYMNPERRRQQIANGLRYVEIFSWESRRRDYYELVDSLIARNPRLKAFI